MFSYARSNEKGIAAAVQSTSEILGCSTSTVFRARRRKRNADEMEDDVDEDVFVPVQRKFRNLDEYKRSLLKKTKHPGRPCSVSLPAREYLVSVLQECPAYTIDEVRLRASLLLSSSFRCSICYLSQLVICLMRLGFNCSASAVSRALKKYAGYSCHKFSKTFRSPEATVHDHFLKVIKSFGFSSVPEFYKRLVFLDESGVR